MLRKALESRQREKRNSDTCSADLLLSEVKHGYFNLALKCNYQSGARTYGHVFPKARLPGYKAACAATSRAAMRLETRGLVNRVNAAVSWWAGIDLTDAGVAVAKSLNPVNG
jgi:hypothetical protein